MRISTLSAHRLTARIAATWDPVLPRAPRLLVPIQLDVLVVRQPGGTWARTAMQLPEGQEGSLRDLLPPPFAELDAPRPVGAYLHWAPPDALAHGRTIDGRTVFPAIPDRWLVVRISEGATARARAVKGWVLRAGDETASAVPLDEWRGDPNVRGRVEAPMTALGHGDAAFVAYFDNVTNRLAFYDDMQGVKPGAVSYQVSGWFSDSGLDPIAAGGVRTHADFERRLDELGWRMPSSELSEANLDAQRFATAATAAGLSAVAPVAALWPTQILCHGSAVGIGWPQATLGMSDEIGGAPSSEGIAVVVGTSPGSAMAALVAQQGGSLPTEPMVEAYYTGALAELDEPDARARIDARLHRQEFGSISGGETTTWIWQEDDPPPPRPPRFHPDLDVVADAHAARVAVESAPLPLAGAFMAKRSGLGPLLAATDPPPQSGAPTGRWVEVRRTLPRFFAPIEPVLLIAGAHRSERHGGDGRFSQDGRLACRPSGACVRRLRRSMQGAVAGEAMRVVELHGGDLLERRIDNGSVPPECEALLDELALLDPGCSRAAAMVGLGVQVEDARTTRQIARAAQGVTVEQTAWWALRDPSVDGQALAGRSGLFGTLPSPIAVTPPRRPWHPVHVDWRIEVFVEARDWVLDEIDLEPSDAPTGPPRTMTFEGRSLLTDGVVRTLASRTTELLASAARIGTAEALAARHSNAFASDLARDLIVAATDVVVADPNPSDDARDEDIADALADLDVLAGSFEGLHDALRTALGVAAPFRTGAMRVLRLRLVDGFGQVVDLAGSSASTEVDPQRVQWSRQMRIPAQRERGLLRPRSIEPARILLRWVDGTGGPDDAGTYGSSPSQLRHVSPVCGFVMPNHLDGALAWFDADGAHLGTVARGPAAGMAWEDAPGRPSIVGQTPRDAIANPFLAAFATGLVGWSALELPDRETALEALLRLVDAARWSIDPFADGGEDHLGLLVGHPVAVMRARLRLDVFDPREPIDPELRARRARELAPIPVRLGALSHLRDGLLGYFVGDDYTRLHVPDPAIAELARPLGPDRGFLQRIDRVAGYAARFADDVQDASGAATPVDHPYIDTSGILWLPPERDVALTLLMEPYARVHVTTGMLPRKEIGMRRGWIEPALARLMPSFRFGPVLVDPLQIRMPVPRQIEGRWSWSHRAAIGRWDNPTIVQASEDAGVSDDPAIATEGWLSVRRGEPS